MPEDQTSVNQKRNLSVLITGGGGLIGKHLTPILTEAGYNVSYLSRNIKKPGDIRVFMWDPEKMVIDLLSLDGIDFIIHLAGTNIGEKRWTGKRKEEIINSRVDSARFLHKTITDNRIPLKAFISASATGIYSSETSSTIFVENDPPAKDFLGSVCRQWEEAADLFSDSGIRTVKIRTAVVLEKNDSALSKLMMPGKFGFLVKTGSGLQYMPWIHVTDLCNIYLKVLEDSSISGALNAVAPQHVTHNEFMKTLGKVLELPVWGVAVPDFVLNAVLGEMSTVILKGSRVSSDKIISKGFRFRYNTLEEALNDVLHK
ncbi:MAG TPA: TIGR01777 family oxidoreductase [Bacteroidales bacterium]